MARIRVGLMLLVCGLMVSCAAVAEKPLGIEAEKSSLTAKFIDDPGLMPAGGETLDFEELPIGRADSPLQAGAAEISAPRGLGIVSVSGKGADGTFVNGKTLQPVPRGFFESGGYPAMTIRFSEPLLAVSLGWFDPNINGNELTAFDAQGRIITSGAPKNGRKGGNHAAFVGVVAQEKIIAAIKIVPASHRDSYSIDNLRMVK